jgi:hypothetical protein
MRNPRFLGLGGAGGDHPQVAVNLHGIGIDDDAAGALGEA